MQTGASISNLTSPFLKSRQIKTPRDFFLRFLENSHRFNAGSSDTETRLYTRQNDWKKIYYIKPLRKPRRPLVIRHSETIGSQFPEWNLKKKVEVWTERAAISAHYSVLVGLSESMTCEFSNSDWKIRIRAVLKTSPLGISQIYLFFFILPLIPDSNGYIRLNTGGIEYQNNGKLFPMLYDASGETTYIRDDNRYFLSA